MAEREPTTDVSPPDWTEISIFKVKFNLPNFRSDRVRWDEEWEKVLHTLSATEAYATLRVIWTPVPKGDPMEAVFAAEAVQVAQSIKERVCGFQGMLVNIWNKMEEMDDLVPAWLLLEDDERRKHLLKGLEDSCVHSPLGSWHQDARALCPEITVSAMLKRNGAAFTSFVRDYRNKVQEVGEGSVYFLPSRWWSKAVDGSESVSEPSPFAMLTLQRNHFIVSFLVYSMMSIIHDLAYGSPAMNSVKDFLQADPICAKAWTKMIAAMPSKPLIRCQNCTKTPEEVGRDAKFMMCSACRKNLNFFVHYCSLDCQKQDWNQHKKHCGKEKKAKPLKGTARDPYWRFPELPDHMRRFAPTGGNVAINSIGLGTPTTSHSQSPAFQRQVSLINGDKDADYFLFDELDRPIRFMVYEPMTKMTFRMLRAEAMFDNGQRGLPAIGEYLVKAMSETPGLSREGILAQLSREYSCDATSVVAEWEEQGVRNGYERGMTFLEMISRNLGPLLRRMPQ